MPGNCGEGESPLAFGGCVSVDFAGPFLTSQGRGRSKAKRYLTVFSCQLTRAVYLLITYSLDAADCLEAFLKFMLRKGVPKTIVSDRGTNLMRVEKDLKQMYRNVEEIKQRIDD